MAETISGMAWAAALTGIEMMEVSQEVGGTLVSRKVDLTRVKAFLEKKNNLSATRDPLPSDDTTEGFEEGSRWKNATTGEWFILSDPAEGDADWQQTTLTADELGGMAVVDDAPVNGRAHGRADGSWVDLDQRYASLDAELMLWQGI